jgi:hypothetical protein
VLPKNEDKRKKDAGVEKAYEKICFESCFTA